MIRLNLKKMRTHYNERAPVTYALPSADGEIALNPLLGQSLKLQFTGTINCIACGRKTSKSFQQGYCFPCTRALAQCDMCLVKPELCHYSRGTCRQPAWGEAHCLITHTVYLANSSGLKVGITRGPQALTRWMDQGAVQAIALAAVGQRLEAGYLEVILKEYYPDKTNWRTMLKGGNPELDLEAAREEALGFIPLTCAHTPASSPAVAIAYPVLEYPSKVSSLNLDKQPLIEGTLLGIKAQYWLLDTGVINIRSFGGYEVELQASTL